MTVGQLRAILNEADDSDELQIMIDDKNDGEFLYNLDSICWRDNKITLTAEAE